jgi:hypothetical protein
MCKTKILGFSFFILASLFITVIVEAQAEVGTATASQPYVTGYKGEGFHGESEKFLIGEYRVMEKGWKDEIKSITLTGAVRVTLYDKEQFEGKKLVIEHSMPKLGDMGGEASSMLVEPFTCSYVTAFKKTMYDGNSKEFQIGDYPELTNGWDDMQSIDLCGGVEVTMYKEKGFAGESQTLKTGRIDLGKFRKKVKSMKVVAAAS